MASVVSYQIEVVWIFLKKGIYKFPSTDFTFYTVFPSSEAS